jgi:hypothetical protein
MRKKAEKILLDGECLRAIIGEAAERLDVRPPLVTSNHGVAVTYDLSYTAAVLIEALERLAAIAALQDNGEPVSPISALLDFEVDAERDVGDLLYQLRDQLAVLI